MSVKMDGWRLVENRWVKVRMDGWTGNEIYSLSEDVSWPDKS